MPAYSVVHVTLYEYDSATGLRNPLLSQVQGTVGGTMTLNGKTVSAVNPEEPAHTFAIPELGVFVPLPGVNEEAKNFCEEAPVRTVQQRPPHDHLQLPHRQARPLPLAVLRALRRGHHRRQRRPDADARLHGRLPRCRLARGRRPGAPAASRTTRAASCTIWLVATVIALPLVILLHRPAARAGNGSEPGGGRSAPT